MEKKLIKTRVYGGYLQKTVYYYSDGTKKTRYHKKSDDFIYLDKE